ncbi:MAG: taurine ABC transporter substrate-binding protein [Rhizobiales bacterium]|nr:taurine ABC transporter substrate-binding protein [Hyphomicrobiales bacterium]
MKILWTVAAAGIAAAGIASAPQPSTAAPSEITVAYFLEWPMPFQYAKVMGTYEKALGIKINWRAFETGTAMSAAMASGDVHLSVSQGVPPFVVATSAGQDLQIVDIAVSYSENDNCVVRASHGITKDNAKAIEGKKVGVPIGTAAHFGFLKQMAHFGIDTSKLEIVDMSPQDGAAAFAGGNLDMVCGWGGALRRMKEHGNVLLTGAEKEALGIFVFDVTSAPSTFVAENPDLVAKFLRVTADANQMYLSKAAEMIPVIAKDAGMDEVATKATLDNFHFPTVDEQLGEKWFGGGTPTFVKGVADFFVSTGNIPSARDSYESAINTGPLQAAKGM